MKTQALLKIVENQRAFKTTITNETVDKLKYNHLRGNFMKSQAFHKYLQHKISYLHNILDFWNTLAAQAK